MLPLRRGRPPSTQFAFSISRNLTPADLLKPPRAGRAVGPPIIQKLRHRHHLAARLVASGHRHVEIAEATGFTPQRIGDLTRDPAFADLVAIYASQIAEGTIDEVRQFNSRLVNVATESLEEIQTRLDDDVSRKAIPTSELRQLVALGADRTIAPPKTASPVTTIPTTITFNMGNKNIQGFSSPALPNPSTLPTPTAPATPVIIDMDDDDDLPNSTDPHKPSPDT